MPRIVVIDDDLDLLKAVKSLLRKRGFENVSVHSDWSMANDDIKIYKPQLILLDVFLGNVDGLEICKRLKSNLSTRSIPIIMLSAFPKIAQIAVREFGARDFICKPFAIEEFLNKIMGIVANRQSYLS